MLSTVDLRSSWGPNCTPQDELVVVHTPNGVGYTVRKGTEEAWKALDQVMHHWEYIPRPLVTGAFNCRKITGGSGLSLHSFGIARDTNWDTNPYGSVLITDRPKGMIADLAKIKTKGGLPVFRWGGTYPGNKDAMHDEIVVTPGQLAWGIDWSSVVGFELPTPDPDTHTQPVPAPDKVLVPVEVFMAGNTLWRTNVPGPDNPVFEMAFGFKRWIGLPELQDLVNSGAVVPAAGWDEEVAAAEAEDRAPDYDKAVNVSLNGNTDARIKNATPVGTMPPGW